jgi:hypothetical protein
MHRIKRLFIDQEVQKWLLKGLVEFRADPEFGWATTPNG